MPEDLEKKREGLLEDLAAFQAVIELFEDTDEIRQYQELLKTIASVEAELKDLDFEIAKEGMRECSHIFVTSQIDGVWDGHRKDTCSYFGCIKCGLDSKYLSDEYMRFATELQQQMRYIYEETLGNGVSIKEECSLELGMAIYKGILVAHPNISDELAIQYFRAALHNIRTNKKTKGIEESRVKRLGLHPHFRDWNPEAVH